MTFQTLVDDLTSNQNKIPDIAEDDRFVSNIRQSLKPLLSMYSDHINSLISSDLEYGHSRDSVIEILHSLSDNDNITFLESLLNLQRVFPVNALNEEIPHTLADLTSYSDIVMQVFGLIRPPADMEYDIFGDGGVIPFGEYNTSLTSKTDGSDRANGWMSWSGVDATVVAVTKNGQVSRVLPEIGTISFSISRDKFDVGGLGSVSRKGHTSGRRTIAGSIIGIVLKDEPLKHLQPDDIMITDNTDSKGPEAEPYIEYLLPDQLEDFDIIISLQNEIGHRARIAIFGVTILNVGQTVSIQDLQTEIVYQYSADDIDLFSYEGGPGRLTKEGNVQTSSFILATEILKTRKAMIDSGISIHSSPFKIPNFWTVVNKKTGKVTDVLTEIQANSESNISVIDSGADYSFKKTYYSGSSALVYFNHIWIPDVTSIVYNGTPQDAPIFGYSSENFDAVTKGNYIVNGNISMNFIRSGYINEILRLMWYELNVFRDDISSEETKARYSAIDMASQIIGQQHMTRIADYILYSTEDTEAQKQIIEYRKAMKQLMWKPDSNLSDLYPIYRADQATASREYYTSENGTKVKHEVPPLNIYIVFGNPLGDRYEVKKLCDVRFTSYSQTVQDDGTPIQEVHGFIARDMDAPSIDELSEMGLDKEDERLESSSEDNAEYISVDETDPRDGD